MKSVEEDRLSPHDPASSRYTSGMKYLLLPNGWETNISITLYLGYHAQKKEGVPSHLCTQCRISSIKAEFSHHKQSLLCKWTVSLFEWTHFQGNTISKSTLWRMQLENFFTLDKPESQASKLSTICLVPVHNRLLQYWEKKWIDEKLNQSAWNRTTYEI